MMPVTLNGRPPLEDRLRLARKSAGLRIIDVAKAAGVDKATASRWAQGKQALSHRHRVILAVL
ncbi:MAG: helix-turn-helix transcriptional regulator [Acidimicrobiaceae bacterium]|nr:helix-turn-helix transcriptional regulator [Acidimicrobiaceae bacterium]